MWAFYLYTQYQRCVNYNWARTLVILLCDTHTSPRQNHGWDQGKIWILERWEFTLKMPMKTIFYCFLKAIWVLKSGCRLKSPIHASVFQQISIRNWSTSADISRLTRSIMKFFFRTELTDGRSLQIEITHICFFNIIINSMPLDVSHCEYIPKWKGKLHIFIKSTKLSSLGLWSRP